MFQNFELNKVHISDKYFAFRRNLVKKYIIEFDINRLMHTFKVNAGIESWAKPLGGWEDTECGLRGHFVGHFLSSCSKLAFGDMDKYLKSKANEIVDIMEKCALPSGYLSAFKEDTLDILELEENRGVWAPYYTLHKILQGLVDCYTYLNNKKALTLAVNLACYIYNRFEKLSYWKIDGILRCTKVNPVNEFGGIGDALYSLYEITLNNNILELAYIFDREYFVDSLAEGKDVLENLHANTHLPIIIASMHRNNISGEELYKVATENFYKYLRGRTFANGNNSSKATAYIKGGVSEKSEHWGVFNMMSDTLTGGESESCCAHNTEKIAAQLFKWSGAVEFLDHIEILKYNAVLNCASNKTGLSQYHQPMGVGAVKKFSGLYDTFWCCTGSGVEAFSEIQKDIWFKSENSILMNMFITSAVVWDELGVTITQLTEYPDNLFSTLTIGVNKPTEFRLILKESSVKSVKINGLNVKLQKENRFAIIHRVFNNNDKIEIEINALLHLVPLKGCEDMAAIMYGSVLLAQIGENQYIEDLTEKNINQKLMKSQKSQLSFIIRNKAETEVEFVPLFRIEEEAYTVYMKTKNNLIQKKEFIEAQDGRGAYINK